MQEIKSLSSVGTSTVTTAQVNTEVDNALNTIVPASPTAGSLNDILSKAAGGNTFSKATDSLEALSEAIATTDGVVDNILLDTQIRRIASGVKAITNAQTKYLSIDSGTNGAEILSVVISGVIGAVWTLDVYVPAVDDVAAPAAADLRSSISYAADGTSGGLLSPFSIPYNCFLDFTNGGVAEDNIDQVQIVYRSRGILTVEWEA